MASRRLLLGWTAGLLATLALAGCNGTSSSGPGVEPLPGAPVGGVEQTPLGSSSANAVKAALILPMTATGNAGAAAQSMKNAAEMALAEFQATDVQLIVKNDGGTAQGAEAAAREALAEGAAIILGPIFAHSVAGAAQVAKPAGVPVIAFSTDANVASRGVYLMSFLPESDVQRIVDYAVGQGKRSFAVLIPETGYGTVVEAELQQAVAKKGARIVAIERYPLDKMKMAEPIGRIAGAVGQADALIIPDAADAVPTVVATLAAKGIDTRRIQLLGTGLWDDPVLFGDASLSGAWFASPDSAGFRAFSERYKAKFGADPVRTASLAYDAVALVAALSKTQGSQRFSEEVLTNPSGFAGVDGVFRLKADGTNERGLAVMVIRDGRAQTLNAAPRSFSGAGAVAAANPGQ
jgi:branched-chain amino acid transport system substrate-binding protein